MLHTDLPIYKKGCALVALAFHVQKEMPRSFKRSLGDKYTLTGEPCAASMVTVDASQIRAPEPEPEPLGLPLEPLKLPR